MKPMILDKREPFFRKAKHWASVTCICDGIWQLNKTREDYPGSEGSGRCWRNPILPLSFWAVEEQE